MPVIGRIKNGRLGELITRESVIFENTNRKDLLDMMRATRRGGIREPSA